jgi:hypothetical protein
MAPRPPSPRSDGARTTVAGRHRSRGLPGAASWQRLRHLLQGWKEGAQPRSTATKAWRLAHCQVDGDEAKKMVPRHRLGSPPPPRLADAAEVRRRCPGPMMLPWSSQFPDGTQVSGSSQVPAAVLALPPVLLATPASTNFSGRQDAGLWAPWLRTRGRVCTSTAHGSRVPCLRPRSSNAHGSAQFLAGRGTQNLARRRSDHSSGRIAAHGNNGEQQRPVPFFGPAFNSLAPSLNTTVTCQVQAFNVFSVYGFLTVKFSYYNFNLKAKHTRWIYQEGEHP